jgi:ParB/RepB/Spo0J family partition protein
MAAKNKFMNAMKMPAIADIFSSEAERQQMSGDLVTEVPLSELHPFVNHPFEVRDDEDMQKLVDSIKENGVLTNLTVRPRAEGGYEIISGHRRFHAAQLAGLDKIKVQVRNVDDDQAIIDMVDANIQREHISPMEKARAYAMKLEAISHQGERRQETSNQVGWKLESAHGATGSELSDLPEEYNAVADGKISAADCTGNIVLDESANLYRGELNDWFYSPDELTVTFTVVTGEGENAVSDDYEVTFSNATAIPWCPGELNDGQYGHYDLNCTIYLTGYDRYTDPETQAPNGADGGTGNLEALAESCDAGTLTRTIIKQDQYGNEYAGNAVSARYTKTITLPNGASGFQGWYKDGEDAYGNVEWASLLYRMDWEELYGIVDGIKCRATGSGMTEEELRQLFASLNIDATTARGQVVAFALSCQGKFVYAQPSSLRGGPGNPSVGINLDCSSFVQYCYWAQNLPFSAGSTAAYRNAADLVSISPSEVQPGDLRVVYASGGEQGHVQMALGGGAWIECCYGYGVAVNMSNVWMESRPCYYFRYAGF